MARLGPYVIEQPYSRIRTVTLDAAINPPADGIWTNAAGNISVKTPDGSTTVFTLAASSGLNIAVTEVTTANTTIAASALRLLNR